MSGEYRIEWKFTPVDFFEDEFEATLCDVPIKVRRGSVFATMDGDQYTLRPRLHEEIAEEIRSLFHGAQVVCRVPFTIESPTRVHINANGQQNIIVGLLGNEARFFGGAVDLRHVAPDGKVLVDTRSDRIEKKRRLALLVCKHRHSDATLRSMLRSVDGAANDAADELLHLYEVKDAACAEFGGNAQAISQLGVPKIDWDLFHRICNELPLNQGRHRGISGDALRDATDRELKHARETASAIVTSYLEYLDRGTP